jgi:hypothetical protein
VFNNINVVDVYQINQYVFISTPSHFFFLKKKSASLFIQYKWGETGKWIDTKRGESVFIKTKKKRQKGAKLIIYKVFVEFNNKLLE